ncbi:MAG: TonB-dependent receptor [Pseudomonadales bacterium]
MSGDQKERQAAFSRSCCRAFVLSAFAVSIVVIDIAAATAAELEEIVVTARKREESVRNIPVAVTAVSGEQMTRYNLKKLEDVAELTPQVTIYRSSAGNGASVNIRGIGPETTSIGVEQSVAAIVDGAYYGQGRIINEGMFDASQIEILKGPQALFFGKNATAGALNIRTNNPGQEREFVTTVGYEFDAEQYYVEGIASTPINDQLGIRLAARYAEMDSGWIDNEARPGTYPLIGGPVLDVPAPSDDSWPAGKDLLARLTLMWEPNEDLTMKLKAHYNEYESASTSGANELVICNGGNGAAPGFSQLQPDTPCNKNWKTQENPFPTVLADSNPLANVADGDLFDKYDSYAITLDAEYESENVTITSLVNFQHLRNRWGGDFDTSDSPNVYAAEEHDYDAISGELRALTALDGPFNFMIGAFLQSTEMNFDQDVIFAGAYNPAALDPEDVYTAYQKVSATDGSTYSFFAQGIWNIRDDIELTGGARYHHENKTSFFEQNYVNPVFTTLFAEGRLNERQNWEDLSPEFTLTWAVNDNVTAYAAYKEAFKAGGFSISGILGIISGTSRDFLFDNEKVKGFEAGIKASLFDNTVQVEFEVYDYEFDDLQIDFFNSDVFALITENAGSASTTGAEAQFRWAAPIEGLTLRGSVGYNDAKYDDFVAPCWSGQGQNEGCTIFNPGEVPKQQLAGATRNLAPEWTFVLGANYDRQIGDGLMFGFSVNTQFRSEYQSNAFDHPDDWQDSSELVNAAIRLGSIDERWQVAIIGKNLTDKFLMLNSIDSPSSGSPPGQPVGGVRGDQRTSANRPRSIALQATVRF